MPPVNLSRSPGRNIVGRTGRIISQIHLQCHWTPCGVVTITRSSHSENETSKTAGCFRCCSAPTAVACCCLCCPALTVYAIPSPLLSPGSAFCCPSTAQSFGCASGYILNYNTAVAPGLHTGACVNLVLLTYLLIQLTAVWTPVPVRKQDGLL